MFTNVQMIMIFMHVPRFKIFKDIFIPKEEIILRDYLALERTRLANERTLLAYSRTSLYMLLGGIAFLQLEGFERLRWLGYLSILISIVLIFTGLYRYFQIKARLSRYYRQGSEGEAQANYNQEEGHHVEDQGNE